jgi:pentatricopeptide repeat protein
LQGLAKVQSIIEAVDVFEEMLKKGLKPNERTYNIILVGLAHMGYVLKAAQILQELGDINALSRDALERIQSKISRIV